MEDNRDRQRLNDILESINNIESFIENKTYDDLNTDTLLKSGVMAQLMIIGEAANHISEELKNNIKDIEWNKIIGLRNILIHEYFGVIWEVVWDTIKEDLPKLKSILNKYF